MADRSCGGFIGWAAGSLKKQQKGTQSPWKGAKRVARALPYEQGEVNLWTGTKRRLFIPRNERLQPSEEPRKQVGHERGKFACWEHQKTQAKNCEWKARCSGFILYLRVSLKYSD